MSYNYTNEDSDDAPKKSYTDGGVDATVSQALSKVQTGFSALETQIKQIFAQIDQIKKTKDGQKAVQLKQDITTKLATLGGQTINDIQSQLTQLNKAVLTSKMAGDKKQQIQQQEQKLKTLLQSKTQQIGNLKTQFQKVAEKIEEQAEQGSAAQFQNFEMKMIEEEIDGQFDEIKVISREFNDINSLMNVMAGEVVKADEKINVIEAAVVSADNDVDKGKKNLQDTRVIQKSKNKWLFIGLGVMAGVAVIVILVVFLRR